MVAIDFEGINVLVTVLVDLLKTLESDKDNSVFYFINVVSFLNFIIITKKI